MESEESLLLIPKAKLPEFPPAIELVTEAADLYVQLLETEPENCSLEIETRLGFKVTNEQARSNNGFDVLNCKTGWRDHIDINRWKLFKRNNKLERKKIEFEEFISIENFFKLMLKENPQNFQTLDTEFSIDFQIKENDSSNFKMQKQYRASYFPKDNRWTSLEKRDKTVIDVLDGSFCYRIGLAFEESRNFDISKLDFEKIDCIRIKSRKYYLFSNYEYCFTTVIEMLKDQSNSASPYYKRIVDEFIACENKGSLLLELFMEMGMKGLHEYEIESEYKILKPLTKNRTKRQIFQKMIQEFLYNTKLLESAAGEYKNILGEKLGVNLHALRAGLFHDGKIIEE